MANPYEEGIQAITGAVETGDVTQVVDGISNVIQSTTNNDVTSSVETGTTSTEIALATPVKELDYAGRKQKNEEFYAFRKLPNGEEKTKAANEWAMKYHGMSYPDYEAKKKKESSDQFYSYLYANSAVFNPVSQERMMSPAVGLLDFGVDIVNWASSPLRQPFNTPEIPKIPKFENEANQALREISSLVLPFILLKGKAVAGGGAIHKSGIASKHAPQLYRLGNSKAFQNFAKFGLDLGVGGLTDSINKINAQNDTLATSWIDNKWWGWQMVPQSLHTGGKTPDEKHRANVLEGIYLSFYTNVLESFYKLTKALRGKTAVTEYLTEAGKKSTKLNAATIDPLDNKVFDADNDLLDRLKRTEEKELREVKSLSEYYVNSGKIDDINTPTVGIHKFEDTADASVLTKDFDGIVGAAKDQAQIATNTNTTFGRLANTITEGFRKSGLDAENITNRTIIKSLRDELVNAGKYSVKLPDGSFLSWKQIDTEGTLLAEVISDPTLPKGDLIKILDNFKVSVGKVEKLNKVGYNAVKKANKEILKNWADINTDKATAYFLTSEAGQISDIAEGTRLVKDGKAVKRANDLLLDRLELFEIESKVADFNFNGRNKLLESLNFDPKNAIKYIDQIEESYTAKLAKIIPLIQPKTYNPYTTNKFVNTAETIYHVHAIPKY